MVHRWPVVGYHGLSVRAMWAFPFHSSKSFCLIDSPGDDSGGEYSTQGEEEQFQGHSQTRHWLV